MSQQHKDVHSRKGVPIWVGTVPAFPPTLVGAVGVRLVAVVAAVVVSVTGPVLGDAAAAVALELNAGAGVAAARLVAVVPAVVVCEHTHRHVRF